MRPRGIPAENPNCEAVGMPKRACFNEAAGNTRGKRSRMPNFRFNSRLLQ